LFKMVRIQTKINFWNEEVIHYQILAKATISI
jgi:hypothetical protein